MITLSLCMIVKNEEDCLSRCLDSVKGIFDEIIIVDTGSEDNTLEIAKRYTEKVYPFEWTDDFSAARNFSFSKATCGFCMWLDADDILTKTDSEKLLSLKASLNPDTDIVMMKYNTAFDDNGSPVFSYYRERIIKNPPSFVWQGEIHEAIVPSGNVIYSDIAISHKKIKVSDPQRNIRIFEKMLSANKSFSAREKFYYARELYYHSRYDNAISVFNDFLSSNDAWIENIKDACIMLADCYMSKSDTVSAMSVLSRSIIYGTPRGEILCKLGEILLAEENYTEAVFWYEKALSLTPDLASGGFISSDCYGFIPAIWLCVCYDRLGNYEKAYQFNELALSFKPNSDAALANKKYLEKMISAKEQ